MKKDNGAPPLNGFRKIQARKKREETKLQRLRITKKNGKGRAWKPNAERNASTQSHRRNPDAKPYAF
ncbi:hypothetical protein HYV43_04140 [Candidatus Micrarchaeota archaeon]|nr:hypothetical protein [Candidatus Micrarchaeota archaeon]